MWRSLCPLFDNRPPGVSSANCGLLSFPGHPDVVPNIVEVRWWSPPETCQMVGIGLDQETRWKGTTVKKKVAVVNVAEAEEAARVADLDVEATVALADVE